MVKKTKGQSEGTQRVIDRVNANPPTRKQMAAYAKACGKLPPEDRVFEVHVITWARLFPRSAEQGYSAVFRMKALARLLSEGPLPGWTELSRDGALLTREDIFAAAAAEPVIQQDSEVAFDRESLIRRTFQLAKRTEPAE